MSHRRLTLASALLVSLFLHLLLAAGGAIRLPDWPSPPDEVLSRRTPAHVQRVRLLSRPPAPAPRQGAAPDAHARRHKPARPHPNPAPELPSSALTPPASADAAADATDGHLPSPTPPEELERALPAAVAEPAPAFPVQLSAGLEARVNGLSTTLEQHWVMEGLHYAIEVKGNKFGVHAIITSEGHVHPEGGLSPERSRLVLGGKVKSMTEYRDGTLRMGRPDALQDYPLPVVPQDFASIPFHLAVTFNGTPQSLFVSTGRRLYQTRFRLVAEEVLKLPVGRLRTLHLEGERYDYDLREMVAAFDIWLAPDYLNFPVKVSGHLTGGEPIEYRVKWLEIEGRQVLGETVTDDTPGSDEVIPAWLKDQGLKNP